MAIKSYPYSSVDGDRKITASDEAKRLDLIAGSGIIFDVSTSFECSKVAGTMNVNVSAGSALVAGHAIISDSTETVEISASDSTYSRIDVIALKSNINTDIRAGRIVVIKGTAAAAIPVEPALSTEAGVVQIKLAKILIPASVASLSTATLTDLRTASVGKHNHSQAHITDMVSNMYQNGFVNGDMQVWQMGTSIVPSAANKYYTADMWKAYRDAYDANLHVAQTTYNGSIPTHTLRTTRGTGDTVVTPIRIGYNFTTEESKKYRLKKVTVSFVSKIGADAAGTYAAYINAGTGTDQDIITGFTGQSILATLSFTPTTTNQVFTFTTSAVVALAVNQLAFVVKYTPSTATAGANDYIEITNCNWSATDYYVLFSPKSFSQELRDCMIYYEKSFSYATAIGANTAYGMYNRSGSSNALNNVRIHVPFKVNKRATPTVVFYTTTGTVGSWKYERNGETSTVTPVNDYTNENAIVAYMGVGAAWVVALVQGHWVADARI